MTFNPEINLSLLLSLASVAVGGLYFLWKVESRVNVLISELKSVITRIERFEEQMKTFSEGMLQLARQEERMSAIDNRVQEISERVHGIIIQLPAPKKRSSVNRR